MSETPAGRRSIGAVLAGMLTGTILSIGTDVLLHLAGVFPALGALIERGNASPGRAAGFDHVVPSGHF